MTSPNRTLAFRCSVIYKQAMREHIRDKLKSAALTQIDGLKTMCFDIYAVVIEVG